MKRWLILVAFALFVNSNCAYTLPPGGIEWINCTKPHEVYNCGSACQTECATLGEVCQIVNIRCNDACYCVDGYARNKKGVCIPIKDCPPKNKYG